MGKVESEVSGLSRVVEGCSVGSRSESWSRESNGRQRQSRLGKKLEARYMQ